MRIDLLLSRTPPRWNSRIFTEVDFDRYCRRAGIIVRHVSLDRPGWYVSGSGHPQIYLHEQLKGVDWLFVAFHELAHHWLHPPGMHLFHTSTATAQEFEVVIEQEADVVAMCCLIPQTVIKYYEPAEIVEVYGHSYEIIRLRQHIFDRWQI